MFIEKCLSTSLEFRRNGIEDLTYRPYGTKELEGTRFYKHIVPMGLKNNVHVHVYGYNFQ